MGKPAAEARLDANHEYQALDAMADILRACGEHAFDTHRHTGQNMRELAEKWVRHLLLGTGHPHDQKVSGRDFLGARHFVRELRLREAEFVSSALRDFRSMLSAVFSNIERALLADGEADARMRQQLVRLQKAVDGGSIEQLRREVMAVSQDLSQVLRDREQRRSQELKSLGNELRQLNLRLEETRRTAATDALTGVHNRRAFDAFLERVVEFDGMTGTPAALLMIDVDNFKALNDKHGHPVGDAALSGIAAALARTFLRKCDFVSRYGGEEFAVVVRDASETEARRLGERARAAIENLKLQDQPEIALSVSVGVANLRHMEEASTWLKRADDALLDAKRAGKNCCVVSRAP